MSDHHHHFESGAKSSEVKPQYRFIPIEALRRLSYRFLEGADRYGENNWRIGLADPDFLADRLNHAIEHLMLYANGDRSEDHLAAVMWGAAILLTADEVVKAAAINPTPPPDPTTICRRCGHPRHDSPCDHPIGDTMVVRCGCPTFTPMSAP